MERVTLYKFKSNEIKITMEIYFNEKDQLIFNGYDVGQIVTKLQGGYDYEYYYTIEMEAAKKIAHLLEADPEDRASILAAIKANFSGNDAYSKFGAFMRKENVDFVPFTWRGEL